MTDAADAIKKPRQAARRRASERALIEAALSLALDEGVAAVTFEAIGARAGYSRGLASQKFGSKKGLIRAVVAHLFDALEQDLAEAEARRPRSGLEALLDFIQVYADRFQDRREQRAYFLFLADAAADRSELQAVFAAAHERIKDRIAELIERGRLDGSIRREIAAEPSAYAVGALMFGLSMQALLAPDTPIRAIAETAKSMAIAYAAA